MRPLDVMKFDCPRTCPMAREEWCRFRPVLDRIGPVRACSHTVEIKVQYSDPDALQAACKALGWKWLGQGTHKVYATHHTGLGFHIPGWKFPAVLKDAGVLAYDNYNGAWGDAKELEKLKAEYAMSQVEAGALSLGWMVERQGDSLVVHHPGGGTLTMNKGDLDMAGFVGGSCHSAREQLLEAAGLDAGAITEKPESAQCQARAHLRQ